MKITTSICVNNEGLCCSVSVAYTYVSKCMWGYRSLQTPTAHYSFPSVTVK